MAAEDRTDKPEQGAQQPQRRIMMDVPREDTGKKWKRWILITIGMILAVTATFYLANLEPAAPAVDRDIVFTGQVQHGTMVRQVRGPGTLVPEHVRYVSAVTAGRVERRLAEPGAEVTAGTVIMEMTNPDVQLQALESEQQLAAAQARLVELRTSLRTQRLNQAGALAQVRTQHSQAVRTLRSNEELAANNLIPENELQASRDQVEELEERLQIERERLDLMDRNMEEQLTVQESQADRLQQIVDFQNDRLESLNVIAGSDGVLQELNFEPGQWVQSGQTIAVVVQPGELKAVLRIPEVQARDVAVGQPATIDIRSDSIPGYVARIDPSARAGSVTMDVALDVETLPRGARPDLSVDGTIEVARLENVLYMPRPHIGQANSSIGLFRLTAEGNEAVRVTVQLGQTSVNEVEVRNGLQEGDVVILSDMSTYDEYDRVRLR